MILTFSVICGLLAGTVRAFGGRAFPRPPKLQATWLVVIAFLPQLLAFHIPGTGQMISDDAAAIILVTSQAILLIFIWFNRSQPGSWALGLGVALNLLVISLNGGLMPISPETVTKLMPDAPTASWQVGQRLWLGKDIVLSIASTRLWWLSDRFLSPVGLPHRVAFSLGDVFIGWGAFILLWSIGAHKQVGIYKRSNGFLPAQE